MIVKPFKPYEYTDMKTFELAYEQIDIILVTELKEAFEMNHANPDLRKSILQVLDYYMNPTDYNEYVETLGKWDVDETT
jgi:septum formation topological specificity factor MinE